MDQATDLSEHNQEVQQSVSSIQAAFDLEEQKFRSEEAAIDAQAQQNILNMQSGTTKSDDY